MPRDLFQLLFDAYYCKQTNFVILTVIFDDYIYITFWSFLVSGERAEKPCLLNGLRLKVFTYRICLQCAHNFNLCTVKICYIRLQIYELFHYQQNKSGKNGN